MAWADPGPNPAELSWHLACPTRASPTPALSLLPCSLRCCSSPDWKLVSLPALHPFFPGLPAARGVPGSRIRSEPQLGQCLIL